MRETGWFQKSVYEREVMVSEVGMWKRCDGFKGRYAEEMEWFEMLVWGRDVLVSEIGMGKKCNGTVTTGVHLDPDPLEVALMRSVDESRHTRLLLTTR